MENFKDAVSIYNEAASVERSKYHLTLGKLIAFLKDKNLDTRVRYDVGGSPGSAHSYRGIYSDLAFDTYDYVTTAGQLLLRANDANGREYEGYKGGLYRMGDKTPLWLAEYGEGSGLAIVSIEEKNGDIILLTRDIHDE